MIRRLSPFSRLRHPSIVRLSFHPSIDLDRCFFHAASAATIAATPTTTNMSSEDAKLVDHTDVTVKPSSRFHTQRALRIQGELSRGVDVWSLFNPVVFPTAINLGQGFMNWQPPQFILSEMTSDLTSRVDIHHYSHPKGRPRLRDAISSFYSDSYHLPSSGDPGADVWQKQSSSSSDLPTLRKPSQRCLDPETEIQVTAGANGGIYSALCAFLNQGDQVICLEPFFDQYEAEIVFNGGKPVYVPLLPPSFDNTGSCSSSADWKIDFDLLESKLSHPDAKVFLLNTPHNPIGKVFSLQELSRISEICIRNDILVISDEVYDCLVYHDDDDDEKHIRIAALQGMWDRTITVGSAGKSFACTGWRVGWLIGPKHLIQPTLISHTRLVFSANSSSQESVAIGLEKSNQHDFFPTQIKQYQQRLDLVCKILKNIGLNNFTIPQGSYFVMVDVSNLHIPLQELSSFPKEILCKPKDYHIAWFIAKLTDVVVIPSTAFYSQQNAFLGERFVRFSFCKDLDQISEAGKRLTKLKPFLTQV